MRRPVIVAVFLIAFVAVMVYGYVTALNEAALWMQ